MISGILLAGGESRRMGKPKLLLPWKQATIIEEVVDAYLKSTLSELIVVVGENKESIKEVLQSKPARVVENPLYRQGMSTSIRAGVLAADSETEGYCIGLGDQPLITTQAIDLLISSFLKDRTGIAVLSHQGKRGHPVIFSSAFRDALCSLNGDLGGRAIIEKHPSEVRYVEAGTKAVLVDIDTPEDYDKLSK
jgi:molybdenum cofactor cytidylyltransferase